MGLTVDIGPHYANLPGLCHEGGCPMLLPNCKLSPKGLDAYW
jgi:hypothetical protein